MAVIETWFEQDLQKAVQVQHLDGSLFSNNANGNRIGVVVYNNGVAASMSGTVSGYAVLPDGTTVPCTGYLSGNRASVLIPAAAYQPGIIFVSVFLTSGSTVTTLAAVAANVQQARTDSQVSPGSVVTDWTQTINAAMQAVVTANAANMAVEYGSLTYPVPVGKYTIYNDLLYRCTTPIANAESWTDSHWTRVKIADEVSDLKSAIDTLDGAFDISPNLYDSSKDSVGLLLVSNGILYPSYTDYKTTDFIKVNKNDKIRAQFSQGANRYDSSKTALTYGWSFYSACFYKSDKSFISDSGVSNQSVVTAPNDDNVSYVRLTIANSTSSHCTDIAIIISDSADVIPYYSKDEIVSLKENKIPDSYDAHIQQICDTEIEEAIEQQITPIVEQLVEPVTEVVDVFEKSPNLYDSSENVVGLLLASNGVLYPSYPDFTTSGFIPVTPGETLRAQYTQNGVRYDITGSGGFEYYTSCFYNDSKTFISGSGGNNTKLLTVPDGASYFRFTITNSSASTNTDIAIIESESSEIIPFVEPDSIWYLKEQYIPTSYDNHIKDVCGIGSDGIILNIPQKIYAVVGIEYNIYFENITEDWTKYQWDVTCTKGKQMERGYTIIPVSGDVGEYTITIRASIDEQTYKEASSTLVIASSSTASGVSVIVLGDSTTDNGMAVAKIHTDFESASTTVQTLGTRGTAPNKHEGRSGWRAYDYLTVQSRDGVNNPFYNPTSGTFDAAYYFSNSGVSVPDWFFINLGINDVFGYSDDGMLNMYIPIIIGYYDTMIQSLKVANQNMKIGVCVTIPPNDSQDAFGKAYGCSQTRDRCKRNNTIWAEKLIDHFKNSEAERIYLVPIHTNLDTVYNMGLETLPVNARNTAITYESPIGNGGVHPVESGYWQIADVYTAFLKGNAN